MWITKEIARDLTNAVVKRWSDQPFVYFGKPNKPVQASLGSKLSQVVDDSDSFMPKDLSLKGKTVLIGNIFTELDDIWSFLRWLRTISAPDTRTCLIHTNYFWQPFIRFFGRLRRHSRKPSWISSLDIENLLHLNGFEVVSCEKRVLFPFYIPGITWLFNRFLLSLPLIRNIAFFRLFFIRQVPYWKPSESLVEKASVSIVVPCRNEKGNIRRCLEELPDMGAPTEVIFVEGGSTDGTAEEIERVLSEYQGPLALRSFAQEGGTGKGPAVRTGFDEANNDILMILDADLTVRPMELPKFYRALTEGVGDFVMGSRLVYPLEKQAMRTLNILGNKFFSSIFSWILRQPIKDTLCGTKVLWKTDYERIKKNRDFFGDFDPFGDFDLIFGASLQNMKIVEIPIRYQSRTYGDTNISRFRHGLLLLRMTIFAYIRFRLSL